MSVTVETQAAAASYTTSCSTAVVAWLQGEHLFAVLGLSLGILTFIVNTYYQSKRDRRESLRELAHSIDKSRPGL